MKLREFLPFVFLVLWINTAYAKTPLFVTPFIEGEYFCDAAVNNVFIKNDEQAALYCASQRQTGSSRIERVLSELGPITSKSGNYSLGYTLTIPIFRYFKKSENGWLFDNSALEQNLRTISDTNRPVVVYLSANHFTDENIPMAVDLAKDARNVMWTTRGPMKVDGSYFNNPVIGWSLVDLNAPINRYRETAFRSIMNAICQMDARSRAKIVGISVLGEVHELFPNLEGGAKYSISPIQSTDYSPASQQGFRAWLKKRFGTIQALNRELESRYSSFNAISAPSKDIYKEKLGSIFEHIDNYAAGDIDVYGWIHDKQHRSLTVSVYWTVYFRAMQSSA